MRLNLKIAISLLVIFSILLYGLLHFATDRSVRHLVNTKSQNAFAYLQSDFRIDPSLQKQLAGQFEKKYFSPWHLTATQLNFNHIKINLQNEFQRFAANPGFGANTQIYDKTWITNLRQNALLKTFPNLNEDAITVRDSNVRALPTNDPTFSDLRSVSQGYPFDNLQETFIPAGTPLHVIHASKDKSWYYVIAASYTGWLPNADVDFVNSAFKKTWQTGSYAVAMQDNIPLFDQQKKLLTKTRIGNLYPIATANKNTLTILIATTTDNNFAQVKSLPVNNEFLTQFPVPLSGKQIASVANNLMGKPYGWGGVYGYRDCSATTQDLFTTFGIWLPRNSSQQAMAKNFISLNGLSNAAKEKKINREALPFLTLIHMPGHIVLYLGKQNGHAMVFQNVWGLHIYNLLENKDRIVIGKTVITPLCLGEKFINVSNNQLNIADKMINLIDPRAIKS